MSGTVTEMTPAGPLSVVGVRVALTDAGNARFVVSDQNGHYSIPNLHNRAVQVQSTLNGFETDSRVVMLEGDTRFDIQLIRIPPPPTFTVSGVVLKLLLRDRCQFRASGCGVTIAIKVTSNSRCSLTPMASIRFRD